MGLLSRALMLEEKERRQLRWLKLVLYGTGAVVLGLGLSQLIASILIENEPNELGGVLAILGGLTVIAFAWLRFRGYG